MQDVPLASIAALLRHSTTSLVKRYAHLSPAYLKDAVEQVASFGKVETTSKDGGELPADLESISIPTVAKTGNVEQEEVEKGA